MVKQEDGKAYAYFNCRAPIQELEGEIPLIRELTRTSGDLELSLGGDRMGFVAEARMPNAVNRKVADELAGVLNQTYQSSLYKKGEKFSGDIVYLENGGYVSRN